MAIKVNRTCGLGCYSDNVDPCAAEAHARRCFSLFFAGRAIDIQDARLYEGKHFHFRATAGGKSMARFVPQPGAENFWVPVLHRGRKRVDAYRDFHERVQATRSLWPRVCVQFVRWGKADQSRSKIPSSSFVSRCILCMLIGIGDQRTPCVALAQVCVLTAACQNRLKFHDTCSLAAFQLITSGVSL